MSHFWQTVSVYARLLRSVRLLYRLLLLRREPKGSSFPVSPTAHSHSSKSPERCKLREIFCKINADRLTNSYFTKVFILCYIIHDYYVLFILFTKIFVFCYIVKFLYLHSYSRFLYYITIMNQSPIFNVNCFPSVSDRHKNSDDSN